MAVDERWRPSVTGGAVIEHDGRFPARRGTHARVVCAWNNPAGHLEPGETPEQVRGEAPSKRSPRAPSCPRRFWACTWLASCGRAVAVAAMSAMAKVGWRWKRGASEDITYLRFAYSGRVGEAVPGRALDEGTCTLCSRARRSRASRRGTAARC
ncbi:MAG: hypothetical protein U1F25_05670 [Rubrivivax sp.]